MPSFPPNALPYSSSLGSSFVTQSRYLFGVFASALSFNRSRKESKNATAAEAYLRELGLSSGDSAADDDSIFSRRMPRAPPGSSVLPLDIGMVRGDVTFVGEHRALAAAAAASGTTTSSPARSRSTSFDTETPPSSLLLRSPALSPALSLAVTATTTLPSPLLPSLLAAGVTLSVPGPVAAVAVAAAAATAHHAASLAPIPLTRPLRSGSWDVMSIELALQRTTDMVAGSIHSVLSNTTGHRRPRVLVFSNDSYFRAMHLAECHDYDCRPLSALHDTKQVRDALYWCDDLTALTHIHPNSFDVVMCFNLGAGESVSTRGRRELNTLVQTMSRVLRPGGCLTGTGIFRGATKLPSEMHSAGEEYPRVSLRHFRDVVEDTGFMMHTAIDMSLEGNVVLKVAQDAKQPDHPLELVRSGQLLCGRFLATKNARAGAYAQYRHIVSVLGSRRELREPRETKDRKPLTLSRQVSQEKSKTGSPSRDEKKEGKEPKEAIVPALPVASVPVAALVAPAGASFTGVPLPAIVPVASSASWLQPQATPALVPVVAHSHNSGDEKRMGSDASAPQPRGESKQATPVVAPIVPPVVVAATATPAAAAPAAAAAGAEKKSCASGERKEFKRPDIKAKGLGGINEEHGKDGVVVTGISLGLPNDLYPDRCVFDLSNIASIFAGDNYISQYTREEKREMLGMNIIQVSKTKEGARLEHTLSRDAECIQVGSKVGHFDLAAEYGVPPIIVETLDTTYQLAIAAGLEALRDAGILRTPAPRTPGAKDERRALMALPEHMRDDTGVIFASSFPCVDSCVEEVSRAVASRVRGEMLEDLKRGLARSLHVNVSFSPTPAPSSPTSSSSSSGSSDPSAKDKEGYVYNRKLLFKLLVMANSQLAELIGARGPSTQINAACAGTTQAMAMAEDWIRVGRCRRVIVISADNPTSSNLLPYLGTGFLALGAASTAPRVTEAAVPFDKRRKGMILGAGAVGLIVESVSVALARDAPIKAELLGSALKNSAFHASLMSKEHISSEMARFVDKMVAMHGLDMATLASDLIYFSHETCTSANGGCAQVEIDALQATFGAKGKPQVLITNTKGFTGHAMAVSVEDVMAVASLAQNRVPPVANYKVPDPALGELLLSQGGTHTRRFALRVAAGFGSHFVMLLLRKWDAERAAFWHAARARATAPPPPPVAPAPVLAPLSTTSPPTLMARISSGVWPSLRAPLFVSPPGTPRVASSATTAAAAAATPPPSALSLTLTSSSSSSSLSGLVLGPATPLSSPRARSNSSELPSPWYVRVTPNATPTAAAAATTTSFPLSPPSALASPTPSS